MYIDPLAQQILGIGTAIAMSAGVLLKFIPDKETD